MFFHSMEKTYSVVWLKKLLKDQYGKNIKFVQEEGKPDIVYFDNLGDYLISDKWYKERKNGTSDEATRIIHLAAKLIREDLRSKLY